MDMLDILNGEVRGIEFRPAGELVVATADGEIATWDLGDWSAGFRTTRAVRALALVEDDERDAPVFEQFDGKTEVVTAEPAAWEARACQVAGRALSEQEWAQLFGDRPYTPACRG